MLAVGFEVAYNMYQHWIVWTCISGETNSNTTYKVCQILLNAKAIYWRTSSYMWEMESSLYSNLSVLKQAKSTSKVYSRLVLYCRKKQGRPPTGILAHTAKAIGYGSVAELLEQHPCAQVIMLTWHKVHEFYILFKCYQEYHAKFYLLQSLIK
jgi:hypothetical protein